MDFIATFFTHDVLDELFNCLKIILPGLAGFFFSKCIYTHTKHDDVCKKQLELVYLPLYMLSEQYLNKSNPDVDLFIKKSRRIIYKNHPFVFHKTIKLINAYAENPTNGYIYINLQNQIAHDYDSLKKKLGYPTKSILSQIKRMNAVDLFVLLIKLIFIGLLIYCFTCFFLYIYDAQIAKAIITMLLFSFIVFILYIVGYATRY